MVGEKASEDFWDALRCGGALSLECACGRTHFATRSEGFWDQRDLAELRRKAAANSAYYLEDTKNDGLAGAEVFGSMLVWGCPCDRSKSVEDAIWNNREFLIRYLKARTAREKKEAEKLAGSLEWV